MKIIGRIAFWLVALALVTAILISLDYTPGQAVLISLVFFPCAIALEFFLPKADTIRDKIFLSLAVLVSTALLLLLVHRLLWSPFMKSKVWFILDVQPVLVNPVFLGLILTMLALGDYAWRKWLDRRLQASPRQITFFSDRKSVTLPIAEIAYIESNDTEVRVITLDGRSFRNKTGISQWENMLGEPFFRIHRSYLVNRDAATFPSPDTVAVGTTQLPVSRKYRDNVKRAALRQSQPGIG